MKKTTLQNFKEIISTSINAIKNNKKLLAEKLLIPILLIVTLELILFFMQPFSIYTYLTISIARFIVYAMFAIISFRVILSHFEKSEIKIFTWGKREWKFLLVFTLIFNSSFIINFLIKLSLTTMWGHFLSPLSYIIYLVLILILCRICIILPAIAINKYLSFRESLHITKDYKLLMFLVFIIYPILIYAPLNIISIFLPFGLLYSLLSIPLIVLEVSIISVIYIFILKENNYDIDNSKITKD
ncbi:MAG: Unknown protein [uncultured Campylobacterales bacterium]|uniref:DUF624 domain-containing protein n=1 Tax=uncultured Campylobacterales bacterium TaxID=352960 RepID=A0A6S6S867_9BACT|nr:MAG: Unknown protein [uncultured Campylobacterales bacterium]